jgi:hypothetical protein
MFVDRDGEKVGKLQTFTSGTVGRPGSGDDAAALPDRLLGSRRSPAWILAYETPAGPRRVGGSSAGRFNTAAETGSGYVLALTREFPVTVPRGTITAWQQGAGPHVLCFMAGPTCRSTPSP